MRWTAYTARLSTADLALLVNSLTAGQGYAYLAAHVATADPGPDRVVRYLRAALAQLQVARVLLVVGEAPPPAEARPPAVKRETETAGQSGPATPPPGEAARLRQALADAVIDSRRMIELATADGEVEWVRQWLDRALDSLGRALRLCDPPL